MKKLTLILFASLLFFTTASYAENEELIAQVAEVKSKLKALQESNNNLIKQLANYENEIAGWRLALENLEAEIAAMEQE
jgi:cell division protein FtsB